MITRTQKVANLMVHHDYFDSGLWDGMTCKISQETKKRLQNLHIKAVPMSSGIAFILCETSQALPAQAIPIRIHLIPPKNNWAVITELPPESHQQAIYFASTFTKSPPRREEEMPNQMHPRSILRTRKQFTWETDLPVGTEVELRNALGKLLRVEKVGSGQRLEIDLGIYPEGMFSLVSISQKNFRLDFFTTAQRSGDTMAWVDLFIQLRRRKSSSHRIICKARTLSWRYILTPIPPAKLPEGLELVSVPSGPTFHRSAPYLSDQISDAAYFNSDAPVCLKEDYPFSIKAFKESTIRWKGVSKKEKVELADQLPFPEPDSIWRLQSQTKNPEKQYCIQKIVQI